MVDMPETETLALINWPPSPVVSTIMDEVPSPAMIVPVVISHLYSGLAVGTTVLSLARKTIDDPSSTLAGASMETISHL